MSTSGGVGGRGTRVPLLPDSEASVPPSTTHGRWDNVEWADCTRDNVAAPPTGSCTLRVLSPRRDPTTVRSLGRADRSAQHTADASGHNVSMGSPPVTLRQRDPHPDVD